MAPNLQENTHFYTECGIGIMTWVQVFFVHKTIISAVMRVEFVSDRISLLSLHKGYIVDYQTNECAS
jgi:hypothetical protein